MSYQINTKEELESFVTHNWNQINEFLDKQFESLPIPLYSSVDIRESKNKIAPVDNNMYPAGFNNICALDLDCASDTFKKFITKDFPATKTVAIIPESHTKNTFYLDHLAYLKKALTDAGFTTFVASFDEELFVEGNELNLISASKFDLQIVKATVKDGHIYAGEDKIDYAVLNNDQSNPMNIEWKSITTPIHPSPYIGWFNRSKSGHFVAYREAAEIFCKEFNIDPSLIEASFKLVDGIDFSSKEGLEKVATSVDEIKGSNEDMKVFIKGDQGTYGMGISVVGSGEEVLNFNRKDRNKMDIGKNKIKFTSVIVQEGVETIIKYDNMPAEVTIYLIGGKSVGGFMRANTEKGTHDNLNARGMVFRRFCISEIRQNQDYQAKEALYSIIARVSTLAGAIELKNKQGI
ncbi:glutamate--cysteine ligase [Bacteriovorax sp. Seq25_V]|uniref:glutamate--cysteine ligase n=1 Tax=Bacteriovorax sp. Seq25_V TaxID=1201288 RepID=UPI00038A232F|nr:glutamate--cysteine ligase [Bacteriovorax sp. Seq25_V]EQC47564.1 glutamate--cysteine ligase [Bacteriovorax sp. Seq25_V]